ncbi:MAG: carbohydrate-binding protein [Candidatus Krumholzibacteriia bacterium]
MRKKISRASPQDAGAREGWLDVERTATVEITSEDPDHPVEAALLPEADSGRTPMAGWRAAGPGEQRIRLTFDGPQHLRRIRLEFVEDEHERTQQFVLRCSRAGGHPDEEILRQQWNFSPRGATRETEDLSVDLPGVTSLELVIMPDIGGGEARASLSSLRVG